MITELPAIRWRDRRALVCIGGSPNKNLLTVVVAALLFIWPGSSPLWAVDLRNVLTGYSLTSWVQKDGLPPSVIWAIAQDRFGYLWLGTDAGPLRFDGVRFVLWQSDGLPRLPDTPVRALCASRDGSIWLGFGEPGGVSRLRNGEIRNFGEADGLASGGITMLVEEPDGTVWAANREGLFRFEDERWQSESRGLPKSVIYSTVVVDGQRFVATADGVFQREAGQSSFHESELLDGAVRDIDKGLLGRLWVADSIVGFRELGAPREKLAEKGSGSSLFHDSKGNLWVGTFGQGLWRVQLDLESRPLNVERTSTLNGFSDDGVTSIIEDRDGNIWVATYDGLNRLAPHKMTPVMNLGVISGVEESPDGMVWVGAVDSLIEFEPGRVEPRRKPQPFHGAPPSAMHADGGGTLWAATNRELIRIVDGHPSVVLLPGPPLKQISAITSDIQGGVWLADREQGVFRWFKGTLKSLALPSDLRRIRVLSSLGDRSGRTWLLFADGRVAVVRGSGDLAVLGAQDGLGTGLHRAIYEDRDGAIWLGASEGLGKFTHGRLTMFGAANGFPRGSVIAIVGDYAGVLWLGIEGTGIVRISPEELVKAAADSSYQIRYSFYDKFDGFAGAPRWMGNSSSARGQDGRLWFVSGRGVTVIEPRTLKGDQSSPVHVSVEDVLVDGQKVGSLSDARLAARTARIEIDYTVPNLSSPVATRFRYRLEGFDADWIEAGTRRQAFYTNLPPRRYRFRVASSNNDGTWNESDATWEFTISPHFYRTGWFFAASIVTLITVPWAAWRLRIRKVRRQFSLLLRERARLSREIHDTVLQGLFGLALQCDAIAKDLDASSASATKERLLRVRRDAEDYVREARQSILNLRSSNLQSTDLARCLRQAGERATADSPVALSFAVTGTPFRPWADAEEQLLRIGQEALINAVRHAHAREVSMELRYNDPWVILRISDDGEGFELDAVANSNGHCGLLSMKERAEAVGGTLVITTATGRGTQIEATVPASPRK